MIIKPHATHPLEYTLMPNDQLFFLHIPKTAGTTLAGIVENVFNREEIFPYYFTPELIGQDLKSIGSYRYFRGHFPHNLMHTILPRRVVTITMLRKPVERFLSHVDQIKRGDNTSEAIEYLRGLTLEEMVNDDKASRMLQNFHVRMLAGDISLYIDNGVVTYLKSHLTIQSGTDGLQVAQSNLASYAFVGLTERFQESLFLLTYVFNWRPILDYPSLNVAKKRTKADGLDWTLLARIQALNQQDEEIYNQGAALFDVRYQQMTHELLEQYGTRAHAHQKMPLAPEVMFDLLERRYESWYQRTRTFVNNLDVSMNEGIQGTGWHLAEKNNDHGWYRWTGPETTSTLDLPLKSTHDLNIKVQVMMGITPDVLDSLELHVNNTLIPTCRTLEDTFITSVEAIIPRKLLRSGRAFTRLSLRVKETVVPQLLDSMMRDARSVGVAVQSLRIRAVDRETLQDKWIRFYQGIRQWLNPPKNTNSDR